MEGKRVKRERADRCWLCGRNGYGDPLDKHHVFGGAFRDKSEYYGAYVWLCHSECHENGPMAAHVNRATAQKLHETFQRVIMREQGWTREQFIGVFGRNYLGDEDPIEEREEKPRARRPLGFRIMRDAEPLPY